MTNLDHGLLDAHAVAPGADLGARPPLATTTAPPFAAEPAWGDLAREALALARQREAEKADEEARREAALFGSKPRRKPDDPAAPKQPNGAKDAAMVPEDGDAGGEGHDARGLGKDRDDPSGSNDAAGSRGPEDVGDPLAGGSWSEASGTRERQPGAEGLMAAPEPVATGEAARPASNLRSSTVPSRAPSPRDLSSPPAQGGLTALELLRAAVPIPALADVLPLAECDAMLAAGEDPFAIAIEGHDRPARPLPVAKVLAILRLAATFGCQEAWHAARQAGAVTLIDAGALGPVDVLAAVLQEQLLPGLPSVLKVSEGTDLDRGLAAPRRPGVASTASAGPIEPSALLLAASSRTDHRTGAWDAKTIEAALLTALAQPNLPVVAIVPDPRRLSPDLCAALPPPLPLAPLSRDLLLALLSATHSSTGRLSRDHVALRLPSDRALRRLSVPALLMALREPSAFAVAEALARIAGEPRGGTSRHEDGRPALADLAGMGELERVGHLLVDSLAAWEAGEAPWSDVTRSALLYGEPGTGKTFGAQAIARAAGCAFFATSLAKMQSKGHLGDLLGEMLETFAKAIAAAPSIVFIDEVDSFGTRDAPSSRNANYRAQVIAGLLECLDGVEGREGVVVIAACNDPSRMDPALRRPGRFDVAVEVPRPGQVGVLRVLRRHLGPDLASGRLTDADLTALLPQARGRTPADLDAAVRVARSRARTDRRPLAVADVALALAPAVAAPATVVARAALHEAGHAVATAALGLGATLRLAVTPTGGGGAQVLAIPNEGTAERLEAGLAQLLAGREAERLILGDVSGGAGGPEDSDLARATKLATAMEMSFGLGEGGPLWTSPDWQKADKGTLGRIRVRLARAEEQARNVLEQHRAALEPLAARLADERVLDGDVVEQVLASAGCRAQR